jgi:GDPmannose 4,6-dehydratase
MWKMLQCEQAHDFIIATGESNSLEDFVKEAFAAVNLDWREHTEASNDLFRPTDISEGKGNATKAERLLGWKAKAHMKEVIELMIKAEMELEGRRASDKQSVDAA